MNEVIVPRITSNEDTVSLIKIFFDNNEVCKSGDIIGILESTKTTFELIVNHGGHIRFLSKVGYDVKTDQVIAFVSDSPIDEIFFNEILLKNESKDVGPVITKKAQVIIDKYSLNPNDIRNEGVIKATDVRNYLDITDERQKNNDIYDDFEKIMKSNDVSEVGLKDIMHLKQTFALAQKIYDDKWDRKIPSFDALFDRWSAGIYYGFGERTNISHLSFVIGDVTVGDRTFIGPFTIIDGSGGLEIGSCCSIAAGVHIYSHDTISRTLSGYKKELEKSPTKIGDCCFIGPNSVISKGVKISNNCFVASNSMVAFDLASNTAVAGNPAKIIGKVVIKKDGSVMIENNKNDN